MTLSLTLSLLVMTSSGSPTPNDDILQVFVVPHSHCDPGWWKTFEEYHDQWTRNILTTITDSLWEDPSRRFIWAEVSFFARWWDNQDETKRNRVRKLAVDGRLEFVGGGWVAPDEANPNYDAVLMQLMEGHAWLQEHVGVRPRFGWSIDAFGHSPVMPWVMAQSGMEALVINRVHQDIKKDFRENQKLEFIWRQGWEDAAATTDWDILTHMLAYPLYDIPNTCGPSWDVCATFDFERDVAIRITSANVKERAETLLGQYREKAKGFKHNNLLIPLGDDFKYKTAKMTEDMFTNYDSLFKYINNEPSLKTHIRFATLAEYFDAVHSSQEASALSFPIYSGDFFTYNDRDKDYWSGYFTTRPFLKGLGRRAQAAIRSAETLYAIALNHGVEVSETIFFHIEEARRLVALFQHHDGITGTSRRHVVQDYAAKLSRALWSMKEASKDILQSLLSGSTSDDIMELHLGHEKRGDSKNPESAVIDFNAKDQYLLIVHNSLGKHRIEPVEITTSSTRVHIVEAITGDEVPVQINPLWLSTLHPYTSQFEALFTAEVSPLGITAYILTEDDEARLASVTIYGGDATSMDIPGGFEVNFKHLGSEEIQLSSISGDTVVDLNPMTGLLHRITAPSGTINLNQDFQVYSSVKSGAYIFSPAGPSVSLEKKSIVVHLMTGPISEEAFITFQSHDHELIGQHLRLVNRGHQEVLEVKFLVDMTNSNDVNKELVSSFSNIDLTNPSFHMSSNGYAAQRRGTTRSSHIQSLFFPMTSSLSLEDSKQKFSMMVSQSLGCAYLDGGIQLMLDRRLSRDDGRGLGEGVMDNVDTRISLWIVVGPADQQIDSPLISELSLLLDNPLQSLWSNRFPDGLDHVPYSVMQPLNSFGDPAHFLSFKPTLPHQLTLQVLNYSPDTIFTLDLESLFSWYNIELEEWTSTMMHLLSDSTQARKVFKPDEDSRIFSVNSYNPLELKTVLPGSSTGSPLAILLKPKEIRTFIFKVNSLKQHVTPPKVVTPIILTPKATQAKQPRTLTHSLERLPTLPSTTHVEGASNHLFFMLCCSFALSLVACLVLVIRRRTWRQLVSSADFSRPKTKRDV